MALQNNQTKQNQDVMTRNLVITSIAALVTLIITYFVYDKYVPLYEQGDPKAEWIYTNFCYISENPWSVLAAIYFFLVARSYGIESKSGKIWFMLFLGMFTWAIADTVYTIAYLGWRYDKWDTVRWPMGAPVAYLFILGYVFTIIGIIMQIHNVNKKDILTKQGWIILFIIEIIVLIICIVEVFIPMAKVMQDSLDEGLSTPVDIVHTYIYTIGDIILLLLAVLLVFVFKGGSFAKSWIIIVIGLIVMALYDLIGAYREYNIQDKVYWYTLDYLYVGYYMIFAIGAMHLYKTLKYATI